MDGLISLDNIMFKPVSEEILALNSETRQNGLVLSAEDARDLSDLRVAALRENERIEMGSGAVMDIIRRFSTSHFIMEENYAYVLHEVTNMFYYIKTEVEDRISDRDLIEELFTRFELQCQGSIDTLENREVGRIIRKVNSGKNYHKWYADRDELDYDQTKGSRVAPADVLDDEYGEEFFEDDTAADHDLYEPDDEEKYGRESEDASDFDLDAFDEFFDSLAEEKRISEDSSRNDAEQKEENGDREDEMA